MRKKHVLISGLYVLLTENGNIIVDGVLASNYADVDHNLVHLAMMPMQWIPEFIKWIFGDDIGFPAFVSVARELAKLMLPYGQLF